MLCFQSNQIDACFCFLILWVCGQRACVVHISTGRRARQMWRGGSRAQLRIDHSPDWRARRRPKPPSSESTPCPTPCRARMPGHYSSIAIGVHAWAGSRRWRRLGCSCVSVVERRCLFAAAATVVRSIVPAAVRRRPDITPSVPPVGATRRAAAGVWPMRYGPVAGAPGKTT